MEYVVYILKSLSHDIHYVGYTSNIILRMKQHNFSDFDKNAFTFKHRPWILFHIEFFEDKTEARNKEKQIKSRGVVRYLRDRAVGTPPRAESYSAQSGVILRPGRSVVRSCGLPP